jgi:uncharacterized protein (UPF0261 family)
MKPTVLLIGTLDTKGRETAYLAARVRAAGCDTLILDSGILGEADGVVADFDRAAVARAAGSDLQTIRDSGSRGKAVERMLGGVRAISLDLERQGKIHGVIALGGAEGSVLAAAAMLALPFGLPKLLVSPIASGRRTFGPFVGTKDVLVMHSVVDILGLNPIAREVFDNAAAAIAGMAARYAARTPTTATRTAVAATMLGNTTAPLMRVREALDARGVDLVLFHANGAGGAAMEEAIESGMVAAVLDYTLSELAAEVVGGFHQSPRTRLDAAAATGIPQVVVPGCVDFVVFGPRAEVPEAFAGRPSYYHNPEFTLVRVTHEEQREIARRIAARLNAARGPVDVLVPLRGLSIPNREGGEFWAPDIDAAFRDELRGALAPGIAYTEIDAQINDDAFSARALEALARALETQGGASHGLSHPAHQAV